MEFGKKLSVSKTPIPGLVLFDLPLHGDNRGWFKENWQRSKMIDVGFEDFGPVQNNISFNTDVGTTRGIHAEPWDKFVSVATGRIFGAWVDLRQGDTFGEVFTAELDPSMAIFVPRGVGNAFQTLENGTAYSYLVNDHWSAESQGAYTFLNLADESVAINWPIPLHEAELSEKDRSHPRLADVSPMAPKKILIVGANGQLGRALAKRFPEADAFDRTALDITDAAALSSVNWSAYDIVINASAYTKVDEAETVMGRRNAWLINVAGVSNLARVIAEKRLTLVHISSDYVFDGTVAIHTENEELSPLGVYGQTKAAADAVVGTIPKHFVIRTSWVIGDGNNFVRTMQSLASRGIEPEVVDDQHGRLSFTADIADAIAHLLGESKPAYGTYNVTNTGPIVSWFDIAQQVFELVGADSRRVAGVTTDVFFAGKNAAPRPEHSGLSLEKIISTGFHPRDAYEALVDYIASDSQ